MWARAVGRCSSSVRAARYSSADAMGWRCTRLITVTLHPSPALRDRLPDRHALHFDQLSMSDSKYAIAVSEPQASILPLSLV